MLTELSADEISVFSLALIDALSREIKLESKSISTPFEEYYVEQRKIARKRRELFQKYHDALMDEIGRRIGCPLDGMPAGR